MTLPANVAVLSELAADHAGYSLEDAAAIAALSRAEERHFWHRTRNRYIARRLARLGVAPPASVLELGCGGGAVSAHLAAAGYEVTGVDGHLPRVVEAARRAPRARFVVHDLGRGLPPGTGQHDVVCLFDVLEHLDDPAAAIAAAIPAIRPGGLLVGTVPALMRLWSEVDARSGHRLRYERGALESLLRSVPGLDPVEIAAFNRTLVPLMRLQRRAVGQGADALARSLRVPAAPLDFALGLMVETEHALSPLLDRTSISGASLWFAGRRRGL